VSVRTFRKVELLAAAFYACSFLLWTLGNASQPPEPAFGPGEELTDSIYVERAPAVSGLEAACMALLVVAVGLTVAAVRLRRSSPQDS